MKNIKEMTRGAIWAEGNTLTNLRFQVRNFLRSAVEATDPERNGHAPKPQRLR